MMHDGTKMMKNVVTNTVDRQTTPKVEDTRPTAAWSWSPMFQNVRKYKR